MRGFFISVFIRIVGDDGIAPELFKRIKIAGLALKDVDKRVTVVYHNPC